MMISRLSAVGALTAALCIGAPCAARAAGDADRYYAIFIDGKAVGYDHFIAARSPGSVRVTEDMLLKISALGSPLDITSQAVSVYGADGQTPVSYVGTITRAGAATEFRLAFAKPMARWTMGVAGSRTTSDIALKPGTMLAAGVDSWERIVTHTTPTMRRYTVPTVNPELGKLETLEFVRASAARAGGDELWTTSIQTPIGPQPVTLRYRRAAGAIVEMAFPAQNLTIRLADKEALENFGSLDYTSHLFASVETPLPNPDALTTLKLRVSAKVKIEPITPASLQHAPRQSFQGPVRNGQIDGTFTIRPASYGGAHAPAFPYSHRVSIGQSEWLKADSFIESNDPKIKALAKTLTASAKTGWRAASAIGHWVHDNIRYEITGSGARQCLSTRTGDCAPHSWLTIALCRAAGVPARIAGGALYTPLGGGSYAQHYWTEVWMGPKDGWIPIDSTTGDIGPFSPAHLTLWRLGALDSLSVKVLDYAPKMTAASAAAPVLPRRANGLIAGYKEHYDFSIDGKNVGAQTAELASVQNGAQHWTFVLGLKVPQGGQTMTLDQTGSFDIADTGEPAAIDSTTSVGGISQGFKLSFAGNQATGSVTVGTLVTPKTVALPGPIFTFLGNILTTWSLATRSVTLATDKPTAIPFFASEALQTLPITFTPQRADTLTVNGAALPCHVYTIAPIGSTLWIVDATGELVKLTDERQKLVVTRE